MEMLACPGCDLLQNIPLLPPGAKARCPRCGETLAIRAPDPLDSPLALALAAAIVFIVANTAPLMTLSSSGREVSTTIIGGAYRMWRHGEEITAVVVAFCAVIAPACYIVFVLIVLFAVRRAPAPWLAGDLFHWADFMRLWSMDEVMLLGILVALVKIAELATVNPGVGLYATVILVVLLCEIITNTDRHEVWKRIEWAERRRRQRVSRPARGGGAAR